MKRLFILIFLIPSITLANIITTQNNSPEPVIPIRKLVIYSTKSFSDSWQKSDHPFKNKFESQCNCIVEFTSLGGGNAILSRLILEGKNSPADLVIGLDNNIADKAENLSLFVQHNIKVSNLVLPIQWTNKFFIPYDYGYLAFIYNDKRLKVPPKSFEELVNNPNIKIIMQDPRSSTIGLGLIAWIHLVYQDKASQFWSKIKRNIITVTKNWSDSYNLFMQGEADMLLSYNSSPVFNMMVEGNYDIKVAPFKEGHYLQVELMGKLKTSKEPELADQFLNFVLSRSFQLSVPINNYMFPVINVGEDLPKEYLKLFIPTKILMTSSSQMKVNRKLWVQEWLWALSKKQ